MLLVVENFYLLNSGNCLDQRAQTTDQPRSMRTYKYKYRLTWQFGTRQDNDETAVKSPDQKMGIW